jgi:hypothetical protein
MATISIPHSTSPSAGLNMRQCNSGKYYFYHKPDCPSSGPKLYSQLIQNANRHIDIWDPYFNVRSSGIDCDSRIFSNLKSGVEIRILTVKAFSRSSTYSSDLKNAILNQLPSGANNIRLGARFIDPGHVSTKEWVFHDRYLICDHAEVYLVGASVGHHLTPTSSSGIYKITDSDTSDFIINLFNRYWVQAVVNELPMTNIK